MKKTVRANLVGRLGNQLFIYAYARALAEERGYNFVCQDWLGNKMFDLNEPIIEPDVVDDIIDVTGYHQDQESLIYSRKQVRQWFQFRAQVQVNLSRIDQFIFPVVAHRRVGDLTHTPFPIISVASYENAAKKAGYNNLSFTSEESPLTTPFFQSELSFVPDFYRLMKAKVLFRANSTFSWWAHVLGDNDQIVYSPVIEGLEFSKEHDNVEFVRGNWPRLSTHSFVTDLHLREE